MRTRMLFTLLALAACCGAEIIERVAATVGTRAITQSHVLLEIRLSAFLDGVAPDFSPASRRAAAGRLADRVLAGIDMEIGKYPAPEASEADAQLAAVRQQHPAGGEAWVRALEGAGVREEDLWLYLREQLALLRFIEARFAPGVQISEKDLRDYYEGAFTRDWESRASRPLPPLEEARAGIEEILRARRVDALLDDWLKEARERTRVEFKEEAFR